MRLQLRRPFPLHMVKFKPHIPPPHRYVTSFMRHHCNDWNKKWFWVGDSLRQGYITSDRCSCDNNAYVSWCPTSMSEKQVENLLYLLLTALIKGPYYKTVFSKSFIYCFTRVRLLWWFVFQWRTHTNMLDSHVSSKKILIKHFTINISFSTRLSTSLT